MHVCIFINEKNIFRVNTKLLIVVMSVEIWEMKEEFHF